MSWKDKMTKEDEKWFDNHFNKNKNKPQDLYKLTFNKEIIVSYASYPVCRAKKSQLIRTSSYTGMEHLLKIERDYL